MYVPHLLSEVNGEADVLVKSPDFFEPVSYTHLDVYKRQVRYRSE